MIFGEKLLVKLFHYHLLYIAFTYSRLYVPRVSIFYLLSCALLIIDFESFNRSLPSLVWVPLMYSLLTPLVASYLSLQLPQEALIFCYLVIFKGSWILQCWDSGVHSWHWVWSILFYGDEHPSPGDSFIYVFNQSCLSKHLIIRRDTDNPS